MKKLPSVVRSLALTILGTTILTLAPTSRASQPNIVFIYVDDWAWNGSPLRMDPEMANSMMRLVEMPNFERIAASGMTFQNAYGSPQCTPARATLLSGKSTARHGFSVYTGERDYFDQRTDFDTKDGVEVYSGFGHMPVVGVGVRRPLDERITSIAEALAPLGYISAHFGKWHLDSDPGGEGYAFHDGNTNNNDGKTLKNKDKITDKDTNPKRLPELTEKSIKFMEAQVADGKPFYLQISHYAVHGPNECFKKTREKFQQLPEIQQYYIEEKKNVEKIRAQEDPAVFLGMAYDLDQSIGQLLDKLEELGIADNTYVIVHGDNGIRHKTSEVTSSNSLYPLNGDKWFAWEGGIRVPTIACGPGVPRGAHTTTNIVNYDFLPTFVEWAGGSTDGMRGNADPMKDIDGVSLAGLMRGEEPDDTFLNRSIYFHYPHYRSGMPHTSVVKGRYKAIYFYDAPYIFKHEYGGKFKDAYHGKPPVMLFDLGASVGEYRNIALEGNNYERIAKPLYNDMMRHLKESGARIPVENVEGRKLVREGEEYTLTGFRKDLWKRHEDYYLRVLAEQSAFSDKGKFRKALDAFKGPFIGERRVRNGDAEPADKVATQP